MGDDSMTRSHFLRTAIPVVWALMIVAMAVGCSINIGGTQERRLVDLNDGPLEKRLQIAQSYVSGRQLGVLRSNARKQFPALTESDLATLDLGWQRAILQDGDHVMVVVTFMPQAKGIDAKAVADYVAKQVQEDLRAKVGSES